MPALRHALLLLPLALLCTGQVVIDTMGGAHPAERLGATIRYADPPRDGGVYPVQVNGWWGLMDRQANLVLYPSFDWLDYDYEGLVRAVKDGKTGFILQSGSWRIEPHFVYADRFEESFAVIGDGQGKFGYIDKAGKLRVPVRLDGALRFREGAAAVLVGDKVGFIDTRGDVLVSPQFRRARSFHEGRAMVEAEVDGRPILGYINKAGRLVFRDTERRFADLGDFNDGYARARVGDLWGFIDAQFRIRIEPRFEDARDFVSGAAAVKLGGKWGYINKRGDLTIDPQFDQAEDFVATLAMVRLRGQYGYINKTGRFSIPAQYPEAQPFFRSYARAATPPSFTYVDVSGRAHWDTQQATRGFINVRVKERLELRVREIDPYNRDVAPPQPRDPLSEPYPPDYLYEEVLPQP